MISAPVGFQCPECVAAAQVALPKTKFGGSFNTVPKVTRAILITCVSIFALSLLFGSFAISFGMIPAAIAQGEWWRLFTSTLLHGSILHLLFNMYALYWLGPQLERSLGHMRFAALYVLSALGGSVASYWFSDLNTVSVGASGAIFGLITATIVIGREMRTDVSQLVVLLGINVVIGFLQPGIDWRAHFGGAVTGAAVAFIYTKGTRLNRDQIHRAGLAGIFAVLVLATFARNAQVSALLGI
ncbi:MAG: rhomboid family intramembrane serine protease [Candidatus Nanopelagicales bacterium]|jgi:membrane associated rhomboid family serine protease|nr:rhomboid family intramembrane serine protease [Candidatus Nanopelagicales bacterium]